MAKRKRYTKRKTKRPTRRRRYVRAANPRPSKRSSRKVARRMPKYKYTPTRRKRRKNPTTWFQKAEVRIAGSALAGAFVADRLDAAVAAYSGEGMVYGNLKKWSADYKVQPSFIVGTLALLLGYYRRTRPWARYATGAGIGMMLPEARKRFKTFGVGFGQAAESPEEIKTIQFITSGNGNGLKLGSPADLAQRRAALAAKRMNNGPSRMSTPVVVNGHSHSSKNTY